MVDTLAGAGMVGVMTDEAGESTGDKVRRAMAEARVAHVRAAAEMGLSQGQLSRRLMGRMSFRVEELVTVAALCGVPVASLIGDRKAIPA